MARLFSSENRSFRRKRFWSAGVMDICQWTYDQHDNSNRIFTSMFASFFWRCTYAGDWQSCQRHGVQYTDPMITSLSWPFVFSWASKSYNSHHVTVVTVGTVQFWHLYWGRPTPPPEARAKSDRQGILSSGRVLLVRASFWVWHKLYR